MLTEERHSHILNELRKKEVVHIQDLVNNLNVSESTIRRDLQELDETGKLERVHGGARSIYRIEQEISLKEKTSKNIHEKAIIGKMAASLIEDEETIYIDSGTTTFAMIPYLKGKKIQVVTNSIRHAVALTDIHIPTHLIGGMVKSSTEAIVGPTSNHQISQYRFSRSFIGTNGIHLDFGLTTPDEREASLKSLAMDQSKRSYILSDHSKFNAVNFIQFRALEEMTVITDKLPPEMKEKFEEMMTILEAKK